ncbi:MAG TPA: redoxin domain-containing protein [Candidatus Binataceae bacterium]|nr:redoxin domain-containing protein [Candidatus Binataceae bacterium]
MSESDKTLSKEIADLTGIPPEAANAEARLAQEDEDTWTALPFQPIRAVLALIFIAGGFGLYEYVLLSFWSSPSMGIHDRIPYPAYFGIVAAMILALIGVRLAIGVWSPHAKLALGLLAFFACAAIGIGGGRFVSYTLRGTLNPPFILKIKVGDHFPNTTLADQRGAAHQVPDPGPGGSLVVIYRGDFDPFARYELSELNAHQADLLIKGLKIIAISADPADRSKMLSAFLRTDIPLLSDEKETLLGPLGLIQRHRDGEPDNAIPAFFGLDREGFVRWIFTSHYYREMPPLDEILKAADAVQGK